MKTETYVKPPFKSAEEVAEVVEAWDATTASWVAKCPRYGELKLLHGLEPVDTSYARKAGSAIHAALALFYSGVGTEECLADLARVWGHDADWRLPPGHKYSHLHLGHLEVIFLNYVEFARKRDMFKPLLVKREDLKLDRVIAGVWQVTDEGFVVLGESKFLMEFDLVLPTGEKVKHVHAGKPDLPILMGGQQYVFDHKTTSSYLSDYWAAQHKHSNQLRGYCAMIEELTGIKTGGALINGVYVGDKASSSESKAAKFARYGPFQYQPAHLTEAMLNQYYWKKALYWWAEQKYFPQNPGRLCSGCDFDGLCAVSPSTRPAAMHTDFRRDQRSVMEVFLSL